MSLLVDISANALDPGYAEAAQRHASGPPSGRPRRRLGLVTAVVLAGLLLAVAGVQAQHRAPSAESARQALVKDVQRRTAETTDLQHQVERLRTSTAQARDKALAATAAGGELAARLSALEAVTGATPLIGPGLVVRLDDAPAGSSDGLGADTPAQPSRVLDSDLQRVVNALFAAGAEAVAINGERLTGRTAIREAGSAILVDFTPLMPPYDVTALGDPATLEAGFATSPTATRMRTLGQLYGIRFSYRRAGSLRVPAASGLTLRYAHAPGGPS